MTLFHDHAEHRTVNSMEGKNIGWIQIDLFYTVPLGKILRVFGQLIGFSADAYLVPHRIQLIALHIVVLPCCLRQLHRGQVLLCLQKCHIHNITLLQLIQRDRLAIFIPETGGSVHG